MPGMAASMFDEPRQIGAHERLAAGEPQPVDAHLRDDADEPRDLFERENLVARPEADVLVRHAVEAADVAAVGDADPQAGVHAAEACRRAGDLLVISAMLIVVKMRRLGDGETRRFADGLSISCLLVSLSPRLAQSRMHPLGACRRPTVRVSRSARRA